MSKLGMAAVVMAGSVVMLAGCASSPKQAREETDAIQAWASSRPPVETVVSSIKAPELASMINTFAPVPGNIYKMTADMVDKDAALDRGRKMHRAFMNDVEATAIDGKSKAEAVKEIKAKLTSEQAAMIGQFEAATLKKDFGIVLKKLAEMGVEIANAGTQAAGLTKALKDSQAFRKLAGLQALTVGKAITSDVNKLQNQIDATTEGIGLLQQLAEADKEAQAYMKDYPIQ